MNFDWLERAEVAGAGFINFFLKSDMVYDTLKAILNAGDQYGVQPLRARDTIQVEYVSANPTRSVTCRPWSLVLRMVVHL